MIKGLILDVDGVLVGGKKGYNWPNPHPLIIQTLKSLRKKGLIVSLCTGKGTFAIRGIVELAHLNNLHIGDGGAVVMDFLKNTIIDKHYIDKRAAEEVIATYLKNNVYVEIYTTDGYYVQQSQTSFITDKHTAILYTKPHVVASLLGAATHVDIVKIMPIARDEAEKKHIMDLFEPFTSRLSFQWGIHGSALPLQFGIITAQHISKKHAAATISKHTHIPLEQFLGVGDGMTDWQFMEICGYAGAMGNGSQELKNKIITKGEHGFIGTSVDENGVLDILKHFGVI